MVVGSVVDGDGGGGDGGGGTGSGGDGGPLVISLPYYTTTTLHVCVLGVWPTWAMPITWSEVLQHWWWW